MYHGSPISFGRAYIVSKPHLVELPDEPENPVHARERGPRADLRHLLVRQLVEAGRAATLLEHALVRRLKRATFF